jgi:hypothetical protein
LFTEGLLAVVVLPAADLGREPDRDWDSAPENFHPAGSRRPAAQSEDPDVLTVRNDDDEKARAYRQRRASSIPK